VVVLVLLVGYFGLCAWLSWRDPVVVFDSQVVAAFQPDLPPGFLMGTATSSYQVEGDNSHCDWAQFEPVKDGSRNGKACDHWNRVSEDIALMQAMGANAYRFSLEWSRLEPTEGQWNEAAWAHYEDELKQLRAAGISPMVTLFHFTLPLWMSSRGGVTAPDFPDRFAAFAQEAARRLGPQVEMWCTLNEPNVLMLGGYIEGGWPPGQHDPAQAVAAMTGMMRAHSRAAKVLRTANPQAKIGIAQNLVDLPPCYRWSLLDWAASDIASKGYNWATYDAIQSGRMVIKVPGWPTVDEAIPDLAGSADFFGLNYYTRYLTHFNPSFPGMLERRLGPGPRTDMDWEVYPEGMLRMLRAAWQRYRLPIYVTENGVAGGDRAAYLQAHLYALSRAIQEGVPVKGYYYWSLLDNFEWAEGFRPRFGLYHVDYQTMERTPAPGSEVFQRWARSVRH
jgi:beta-glucosidase